MLTSSDNLIGGLIVVIITPESESIVVGRTHLGWKIPIWDFVVGVGDSTNHSMHIHGGLFLFLYFWSVKTFYYFQNNDSFEANTEWVGKSKQKRLCFEVRGRLYTHARPVQPPYLRGRQMQLTLPLMKDYWTNVWQKKCKAPLLLVKGWQLYLFIFLWAETATE